MKKYQDWDIALLIDVRNIGKKIEIVCSVHANIHQIKKEIADKIN
jgi:hypothetical protein